MNQATVLADLLRRSFHETIDAIYPSLPSDWERMAEYLLDENVRVVEYEDILAEIDRPTVEGE